MMYSRFNVISIFSVLILKNHVHLSLLNVKIACIIAMFPVLIKQFNRGIIQQTPSLTVVIMLVSYVFHDVLNYQIS